MHAISYLQRCPVCSRLLRIRVTLLGKQVFCQHCGGKFLATDPATRPCAPAAEVAGCSHHDHSHPADPLLERVEAILQRAEVTAARGGQFDGAVATSGQAAVWSRASRDSASQ